MKHLKLFEDWKPATVIPHGDITDPEEIKKIVQDLINLKNFREALKQMKLMKAEADADNQNNVSDSFADVFEYYEKNFPDQVKDVLEDQKKREENTFTLYGADVSLSLTIFLDDRIEGTLEEGNRKIFIFTLHSDSVMETHSKDYPEKRILDLITNFLKQGPGYNGKGIMRTDIERMNKENLEGLMMIPFYKKWAESKSEKYRGYLTGRKFGI